MGSRDPVISISIPADRQPVSAPRPANHSEIAVLPGAVAMYDITELVDPQYNGVAKVRNSALKGLQ
jgi:hypothetical protein